MVPISQTDQKIWFITGVSSGLGRAMCEHVLSQGHAVVATLRKPDMIQDLVAQHTPNSLLVLQLDVTKPDQITDAFRMALITFGHVDVVFNNAGYTCLSEIECTDLDVARALFETNFWGAINVAREALHVFRDINTKQGGYLISVSTMGTLDPKPCFGYYIASKSALNSALEAMSMELNPSWNIKSTIVNLGRFQTKVTDNIVIQQAHPAYDVPGLPSVITRNIFKLPLHEQPMTFKDINKAASQIYLLMDLEVAPVHIPIGSDAIEAASSRGNIYLEVARKFDKWSAGL